MPRLLLEETRLTLRWWLCGLLLKAGSALIRCACRVDRAFVHATMKALEGQAEPRDQRRNREGV